MTGIISAIFDNINILNISMHACVFAFIILMPLIVDDELLVVFNWNDNIEITCRSKSFIYM